MSIRRTPVARAVLVCVVLLVVASSPALALAAWHAKTPVRRSPQAGLLVSVQPVTGLYPGVRRPVKVIFRNTQAFDVLLTSATASTKGAPGCPASVFDGSTLAIRPSVRLRPGHSVTKTLSFGLRATAPQPCQKRSVTVRVTGRVVRP